MPASSYVRSLRERIGHDLLMLPSVAALALDGAGRILLVRNAETLLWQTVGGAVDPGETPEEAALREAREEVSLELELGRLLGVVGGPACRVDYPNGDAVAYVVTVFEARVRSGEPTPDGEEAIEAAWWHPSEWQALPMASITRAVLATAAR